jgi:hypothetical protein
MITTSAHMTYCWLSIHALMRGHSKGDVVVRRDACVSQVMRCDVVVMK